MSSHGTLSRRQILKTMAAASGGVLAASVGCSGGSMQTSTSTTPAWPPSLPVGTFSPSAADTAFLDALEQQGALYFWEQASPLMTRCIVILPDALSSSLMNCHPI
jgi:hypothetical protein